MSEELVVRIGGPAAGPGRRRSESAREAIVRAATELFLAQGYDATGTDQIAATAAVSKQTVYNQFGDKRSLFTQIVLGVTASAETFADEVGSLLGGIDTPDDLEPTLRALAGRYAAVVVNPRVIALRRLVIAEAVRFPELAAEYYARAPGRTLEVLAEGFARLGRRGLITVADPHRAASEFAFLLFGAPLDRGLFHPGESPAPDDDDVGRAVTAFLALRHSEV